MLDVPKRARPARFQKTCARCSASFTRKQLYDVHCVVCTARHDKMEKAEAEEEEEDGTEEKEDEEDGDDDDDEEKKPKKRGKHGGDNAREEQLVDVVRILIDRVTALERRVELLARCERRASGARRKLFLAELQLSRPAPAHTLFAWMAACIWPRMTDELITAFIITDTVSSLGAVLETCVALAVADTKEGERLPFVAAPMHMFKSTAADDDKDDVWHTDAFFGKAALFFFDDSVADDDETSEKTEDDAPPRWALATRDQLTDIADTMKKYMFSRLVDWKTAHTDELAQRNTEAYHKYLGAVGKSTHHLTPAFIHSVFVRYVT